MTQPGPLVKLIERRHGFLESVTPVAEKTGHIKIRLTYLTDEPRHYRSFQLATQYGLRGPFTEETCVFIPQKSLVTFDLEAFLPAFSRLQEMGVISETAKLTKFMVLDEDTTTLAYPIRFR
jgi:hypothetical protein